MMDPEQSKKLEALKMEIRSILITYKHGCTEAQLRKDYAAFNGNQAIPYGNFGCLSLIDMLRAIPEVARVDNYSNPPIIHGVADENTAHIKKLVSGQAYKSLKGRGAVRRPAPNLRTGYTRPVRPRIAPGQNLTPTQYTPIFAPLHPYTSQSNVAPGSSWRVQTPTARVESKPESASFDRQIPDISLMDLAKNDQGKASKYGEQAIEARKNIRRLLLQYSSKIILGNLDLLYQRNFGQALDRSGLRIRDQADFSDFVSDFADVTCEGSNNYEKSLLVLKEQCKKATESENQQDSLGSGATVNELNDRAASVIMPPKSYPADDELDHNPPQSPLVVTHKTALRFVPTDFVYQRSDLTTDQPFLAEIAELETAAVFSILPLDFVEEREDMMLRLQEHYRQIMGDPSYAIPVSQMTTNLACVYYDCNNDRFFRAYIAVIEKSNSLKLTLFLVDYGQSIASIEVTPINNPIRYLHQDFGSFPTDVYKCCLSSIDIVQDGDKATEALTCVCDFCIERTVVVQVVGYFDSTHSIRLWTRECQKSLNDTLVELGLATRYDDRSFYTWRQIHQSLENPIENNLIFARALAENPEANFPFRNQIKKYRVSVDQELYFIRNPFNSWACLPCFELARLLAIDEALLLLCTILRPVKLELNADVAQLFCELYRLNGSKECYHLNCLNRESHIVLYDLDAVVQYLILENFTDGDIIDAFKMEFTKSMTDQYWNEKNDSYNPSNDNGLKHLVEQEPYQQSALVSVRPNGTNQFDPDRSSNLRLTDEDNEVFGFKPIESGTPMIYDTNTTERKSSSARAKLRQTLLRIARPFDRDFGLNICFIHCPISIDQLNAIEDLHERFRDLQRITKNVSCFFRIECEMINETDQMILQNADAILNEMTESSSMKRRVDVYNYCLSIVETLQPHIHSYIKQTEILGMF